MSTQSSEEKGKKRSEPKSGVAEEKDLQRYSLIMASNQAMRSQGDFLPSGIPITCGVGGGGHSSSDYPSYGDGGASAGAKASARKAGGGS